jgi:ABC-2 type transport system ATP-binding protein
VEGLRKEYPGVLAVEGVTFQVHQGEIFGMVGPNGAGKTTTMECIIGLRRPTAGTIRLLGYDPQRESLALRTRTGVQLQDSALPDRLRVREICDLFASFYPTPLNWHDLLAEMELDAKEKAFYSSLSGGQKQRLLIALALLPDPEVVFFDELTTGLDPQARRAMWDWLRKIRQRGKTVFLTTHFMEEAERLCDRVAILDGGRLIALDTPERLVEGLGAESCLSFEVDPSSLDPSQLDGLPGASRLEREGEQVRVFGQGETWVGEVVNALVTRRIRFRNLRTEQPTLEDVFLALTGRAMRE